MFEVGIIKAIRLEEKPFVEVQVEGAIENPVWYPFFAYPGMETNPQLEDEVIVFTNKFKGNRGIVFSGKMLELMAEKDYCWSFKNIKDKETGIEKDKIMSWQDPDAVELVHIKKDGETVVKMLDIEDSVAGSYTIPDPATAVPTQTIKFGGVTLEVLIKP